MAVFATVVEASSFSAAASRLGVSKSAVSKQVAKLEERLGARLLNRTTRRLSLTEVGAGFYQHCARMLEEVDEAEKLVGRLHAEPRGVLRLNAPMSFGNLHLAPAIPDFMALYPDLAIDMELTDRYVDLVEEGFDVAVRIGTLKDSTLVARKLAPARMAVCASESYLRREGTPKHPRDLKAHNCLVYTMGVSPGTWRFRGGDGPVTVEVGGSYSANNGDALRAAAIAGIGIIRTPTFIVGDALRDGRLRCLLGEYAIDDGAVHAVYPHRRHVSPKVRAFVDFLTDRFGPAPYWDKGLASAGREMAG
jgi:DNA-binding transcriptional LysR family regulator